jgi:hypothetical protein
MNKYHYYVVTNCVYFLCPDVLGIITDVSEVRPIQIPHPTMLRDITLQNMQYVYIKKTTFV